MTKVTNLEEMEQENSIPQMLINNAHKLFQAGLGAVMMVQDEVVNLADKLVEQGEATETKSRKRVDEFVDGRKKETKDLTKRLEKNWDKQMENLLHRMNIPTRAEINSLNNKITRLTKKVDELKKETA
ncbi:MAG: phasin family protein [Ardenticatenaceae bacterium]|nr:phasin family protein [Ardenticatenaceae bacterium]MCB9443831.1 phasin family protein [Ardenticatenaceae bacterium]